MKKKLITEDDRVEFNHEKDLSYEDSGGKNVILFVEGNEVGHCKVWLDSEMDGREYLTINHVITYLDTLTEVQAGRIIKK